MRTPSDKVLQALTMLESTCPEEYAIITRWFLESSSDQDRTLRNAGTKAMLFRAQGASTILLDYLTIASDTRKYIENKRSSREKKAAVKAVGGPF